MRKEKHAGVCGIMQQMRVMEAASAGVDIDDGMAGVAPRARHEVTDTTEEAALEAACEVPLELFD